MNKGIRWIAIVTKVHQAENEASIYIENNAISQQIANYNVSDSYASAVVTFLNTYSFQQKYLNFYSCSYYRFCRKTFILLSIGFQENITGFSICPAAIAMIAMPNNLMVTYFVLFKNVKKKIISIILNGVHGNILKELACQPFFLYEIKN